MKKKTFRLANMVTLKDIMKKHHISSTTAYNRMICIPGFRKKYTIKLHRHLYISKDGAKKIGYPPQNKGGHKTKSARHLKHNYKRPIDKNLPVKMLQGVMTVTRQDNKIAKLCLKLVNQNDKHITKVHKNTAMKLNHEDMSIQAAHIDIHHLKQQVKQLREDKAWTHRVVAGVSALGFLGLIILSHRLNKLNL